MSAPFAGCYCSAMPGPTDRRYLVYVDAELCAASAVCMRLAPDLFELDDFADTAAPLEALADAETLERVKAVASKCPTWAIRWRVAEPGDPA